MTLKYENLHRFIAVLRKEGYYSQISRSHLNFFIAQEFGISDYVQNTVVKKLVEFGFLTLSRGVGIFNIGSGWPQGNEDSKLAEKESQEVLDKLEKSHSPTGHKEVEA